MALLAALMLLTSGCAPPPVSTGLQQRVEKLLQIQEQQAHQLTELQQQLSTLQGQPSGVQPVVGAAITSTKPAPEEATLAAAAPAVQPLSVTPSSAEVAEMAETAGLYLKAFAAIATGRMAAAEAGFRTFIERYPENEHVGNARYWMAEAQLAQKKSKLAETALLGIINNPQPQSKAAAAMARLVRYYRNSGATKNATDMLQQLTDRFPESLELKRLMPNP